MTAPHNSGIVEMPEELPAAPSLKVQLPWLSVASSEATHVRELPVADPSALDSDQDRWLGVFVHTPFFPTVSFDIQPTKEAKAYGIVDAIQDHVGGVPHELYPVIVPILPQRYPGYANFVRMPRVIREAGGADATAIIVDLTRTGGNYFAEIVPRKLTLAQLMLKIKPDVVTQQDNLQVFIGRNQSPWPVGESVTMYDGAVVTFATSEDIPIHCGSLEDLLANRDGWGPIAQMPVDVPTPGSLVQYQGKSFFLPVQQTEQQGLLQAVCEYLDKDLHEVTTCGFPFQDLTFQGHVCSQIICVFELPWPGIDRLQGQRRDILKPCATPVLLECCPRCSIHATPSSTCQALQREWAYVCPLPCVLMLSEGVELLTRFSSMKIQPWFYLLAT